MTATNLTAHPSISVQRIFGALFVLGCLNPWTNFGTNSMDSQPWAVLFGIIFLSSLRIVRVPRYFGFTSILVISGLITSILVSNIPMGEEAPRAIVSYITYLVALIGFYNYLLRYGFPRRLFLFAGFSWVAFGIIEIFAPFIPGAISVARTTEDRGLTSLAAEPTFFGVFLFYAIWMILVATSYKPRRLELLFVVMALLSIFLLARSSMTVLYILIASGIYFVGLFFSSFVNWRVKTSALIFLTAVIVGLPAIVYLALSVLEGSRITNMTSQLGSLGLRSLIIADASTNSRVESVVISVHSFFVNVAFPGGLDTFRDQHVLLRPRWDGLFWYMFPTNKIMSWLGAWLHELGIFGLLAILISLLAASRNASKTSLVIFLVLSLGAIPVAFPLLPMLLAMWMVPIGSRNRLEDDRELR